MFRLHVFIVEDYVTSIYSRASILGKHPICVFKDYPSPAFETITICCSNSTAHL